MKLSEGCQASLTRRPGRGRLAALLLVWTGFVLAGYRTGVHGHFRWVWWCAVKAEAQQAGGCVRAFCRTAGPGAQDRQSCHGHPWRQLCTAHVANACRTVCSACRFQQWLPTVLSGGFMT